MATQAYLEAIEQIGYKTESAATPIEMDISPRPGKRIAIKSYGFSCGATATSVYAMQSLGSATLTTAVASNATTGFIGTGEFQTTNNALASSDYIAVELDDGTYQFTTVATGTYDDFSISDALTDSVAAGNKMFGFGLYSDTGHQYIEALTASTHFTRDSDGALVAATAKGTPMKIWHANDAAVAGSVDYIAVTWLNK